MTMIDLSNYLFLERPGSKVIETGTTREHECTIGKPLLACKPNSLVEPKPGKEKRIKLHLFLAIFVPFASAGFLSFTPNRRCIDIHVGF